MRFANDRNLNILLGESGVSWEPRDWEGHPEGVGEQELGECRWEDSGTIHTASREEKSRGHSLYTPS